MELDIYVRFVVALVFVLALIGLIAWAGRRMGFLGRVVTARAGKRIGVIEAAALDGKRRLVLIRRDEVEHLVVLGPNTETVVETGIPRRNDAGAGP
jgi:flagellar protein FliO/FliZ